MNSMIGLLYLIHQLKIECKGIKISWEIIFHDCIICESSELRLRVIFLNNFVKTGNVKLHAYKK